MGCIKDLYVSRMPSLSRATHVFKRLFNESLSDSLNELSSWCGLVVRALATTLITALTGYSLTGFAQPWVTPAFVDPATLQASQRELPFEARVQHLSDGDSFVVRTQDGRRVSVRLSAVDAPEKSQPYGDAARRSLRDLIDNQTLTVVPIKTDPYGRTVARVFVAGVDVGLEQVKAGMAWHYKRYESEQSPRDRREYGQAEAKARAQRSGLWADDDPVPPWRHCEQQRRGQRYSMMIRPVFAS